MRRPGVRIPPGPPFLFFSDLAQAGRRFSELNPAVLARELWFEELPFKNAKPLPGTRLAQAYPGS